ncbi:MAG: holo-ACP synthase, partial [Deltaproteobacteria bacterium]|nr:holo-ACP synthase [Deltaproteobacteria bacterium]
IGLHDAEVGRLPSGQPTLTLLNKAAERAGAMGARRVLISLTHSRTTAGAVVILES